MFFIQTVVQINRQHSRGGVAPSSSSRQQREVVGIHTRGDGAALATRVAAAAHAEARKTSPRRKIRGEDRRESGPMSARTGRAPDLAGEVVAAAWWLREREIRGEGEGA